MASGVVKIDGSFQDIEILKSNDLCIDKAVIKALERWRFCPGEHNGTPIETTLAVPVNIARRAT